MQGKWNMKEQRQPEHKEQGEGLLSAREQPGGKPEVTSGLESRIASLRGGGSPLSQSSREFFEPRFGHDFSKVRVHTDTRAAEATQAVNARAFTLGRDVVFGAGQYQPESTQGKRLMAHELAHTVQQDGAKKLPRKRAIDRGTPNVLETPRDADTRRTTRGVGEYPVNVSLSRIEPALQLLTTGEFRKQLGRTPEQIAAINSLFANADFKALWDYLAACRATPKQDLGPLALAVDPKLKFGGAVRFGGYFKLPRELKINPKKSEHVTNPTELVDTITHELIHAVFDLEGDCKAAGSGAAPLKGGATAGSRPVAAVKGTPREIELLKKLGPGASNPCKEFLDVNSAAQQMIVQILLENVKVTGVGKPTLTFVNAILRRNPAALREYKSCRDVACKIRPRTRIKSAIAKCSGEIIGKYIPSDLKPALFPKIVRFNFESAVLRPDTKQSLDLVALYLKAHPAETVELDGHADPRGTEKFNKGLGMRRAQKVKNRLLRRGVRGRQIRSVKSKGELDRLSTGPSTYWKDRRVEIKL